MKIIVASLADRWSMAIAVGFKQNGHEVCLLDIYRHHSIDGIISDLKSMEPFDFLILRNFHCLALDGQITEAYDYLFTACPYKIVVWYHDSQIFQDEARIQAAWHKYRRLRHGIIFSIDQGDLPALKAMGNAAFHLPICADGQVIGHQQNPQWKTLCERMSCDISFAGNQIFKEPPFPSSPNEFRSAFEEKLLEEIEDTWRYRNSWPQLKIALPHLFEAPIRDAYDFRAHLESIQNALPTNEKEAFTGLFPQINSWYSWYRLTVRLQTLQAHFDLRVYGASEWKEFLKPYPYETPSLSEAELHALYASSKISFCYTKFHFQTSVHERPFLISASGGFALTENREDLRLAFAENEMASYSCEEDLFEKVRYYLSHESERQSMAAKAQARTLSQHLYQHRLAEMLDILKREHFI